MTDLYQIVGNVYEMKDVPFRLVTCNTSLWLRCCHSCPSLLWRFRLKRYSTPSQN
jgi:hypothetical protein